MMAIGVNELHISETDFLESLLTVTHLEDNAHFVVEIRFQVDLRVVVCINAGGQHSQGMVFMQCLFNQINCIKGRHAREFTLRMKTKKDIFQVSLIAILAPCPYYPKEDVKCR